MAARIVENVSEVDGWVSTLMECKQLSEADVKKLCEKVRVALIGSALVVGLAGR
ncbi:hypothetical protein HDU99_009861, partial [Rhizoclosmatium hyalinum]